MNLCLTTFGSGGQQVKGQKTNFIKTKAKSSDIDYRYWPSNISVSAKKIHIGRALPAIISLYKFMVGELQSVELLT